jgi:hypothetical protein
MLRVGRMGWSRGGGRARARRGGRRFEPLIGLIRERRFDKGGEKGGMCTIRLSVGA